MYTTTIKVDTGLRCRQTRTGNKEIPTYSAAAAAEVSMWKFLDAAALQRHCRTDSVRRRPRPRRPARPARTHYALLRTHTCLRSLLLLLLLSSIHRKHGTAFVHVRRRRRRHVDHRSVSSRSGRSTVASSVRTCDPWRRSHPTVFLFLLFTVLYNSVGTVEHVLLLYIRSNTHSIVIMTIMIK